jgi:hypothetical protein
MNSLDRVFSRVAAKRLVQVDLPDRGSHQHEINGDAALRDFFGISEETRENLELHLYTDDGPPEHETTQITFYDARAQNPNRTEWRLYYRGDFLAKASPGDTFVLARTVEGALHGFVFHQDSLWAQRGAELFSFADLQGGFTLLSDQRLKDSELEFGRRRILEDLGIEFSPDVASEFSEKASRLLAENGNRFPSTLVMAEAARTLIRVNLENSDDAIVAWLDAEEQLFYAMEDILLRDRLKEGFESTEAFVETAQSVLQRRKSRMGLSLQHHIGAIFRGMAIRFSAQATTERKSKPDFILPGIVEYADPQFPSERLTMVAAKSTCKDRWRQILTEADRIPVKHLLTLDQAITRDQFGESKEQGVRLVIPRPLQRRYDFGDLLTVKEVLGLLRARDSERGPTLF